MPLEEILFRTGMTLVGIGLLAAFVILIKIHTDVHSLRMRTMDGATTVLLAAIYRGLEPEITEQRMEGMRDAIDQHFIMKGNAPLRDS